MKKYIIIGLLILVGAVFLIKPLLNGSEEVDPTEEVLPAIFKFEDNLATIGDEKAPLEIVINNNDIEKLE